MIAELVKKFFNKTCSQAEKRQIAQYMESHPEEIETYFSEKEWEQFEMEAPLSEELTAKIWGNIHHAVNKPKVRYLKTWMAAAAVLLVLGFGIGYRYLSTPVVAPLIAQRVNAPQLYVKTNNGDTVMLVNLPDGSKVSIMPKSSISYEESYGHQKRELKLVGEAIFEVAPNKNKPFTVFSNQLSTTALGTKFKVSSLVESTTIKVHLYEGKVVVKQVNNEKAYYLFPGDKLSFNKAKLTAKITGKIKAGNAKNKAGANGVNSWYMFDNQNLSEVFEQMEDIYNVKIYYAEKDVKHIKFIGKIEQNDPISTVLQDIALMNDLHITLKGDTYFIKKK